MYYIEKTRKFGTEVFQVVFTDVVVAEFMSEAGATSYLLAHRYKVNASQLEAKRAEAEANLQKIRRGCQRQALESQTQCRKNPKQGINIGAVEPAVIETAALEIDGNFLEIVGKV